ncbi:MAG: endonuclease/exonuclease/phosphatase family protein [Caldilinea sp.]
MSHSSYKDKIIGDKIIGWTGFLALIVLAFLVWSVTYAPTSPSQTTRPATTVSRVVTPSSAHTIDPIHVVTWNIGLDKADLHVIARRIASFSGVDLWGLQEVNSRSAPPVLAAAAAEGEGATFTAVQGNAGDGLHLVVIYNADRYTLLDWWELPSINTTGNVRPSLVLHLREKRSDLEFLFMVNHLYRSREGERHKQARLLNEWAAVQSLPVIAVGDYNFDWDVANGVRQHDAGYDLMTANGRWQWVKPDSLTTTQCSGWPCRYNSVLDFVFTAGPAQKWRAESTIVVEPGDFPADNITSDHRPVQATFWPIEAPPSINAKGLDRTFPSIAIARVNAVTRTGPGNNFPVMGLIRAGKSVDIVGISQDGAWLHLANGAWIAANMVEGTLGGSLRTATPHAPRPTPTRTPTLRAPTSRVQSTTNCHPSYPTVCIPPPPPDLDCPNIQERRFPVVGSDPHWFDGDGDGIGCEWG